MNMYADTPEMEASPMEMFTGLLMHDPYSFFAQLRAQGSVVALPFPLEGQRIWIVTRMEEAVQVLKNPQRFTVEKPASDVSAGERPVSRKGDDNLPILLHRSMLGVDGQDHRRLRGLVSKVFTSKYIQGLRPSIQQIAHTLLDRVAEQGHMDLINDFAFPLPIQVISDMLGVPHHSWGRVREWSNTLVELAPVLSGLGGNASAKQMEAVHAFTAYLAQLLEEKRHHPQEDLISRLVQMDEGERLSDQELLSMVGLLVIAGHETTVNFVGNAMLVLFERPEQLAMLKARPDLIPAAIEELLRFCGPVLTGVPRLVTEEIELGGQHLFPGDIVLVMLSSANHDESYFTNAEELELARHLNRHLAFGHGVHMCLGAPLARLEGEIALTALLQRMPNLRLAIPRGSVTRRITMNLLGLRSLPVVF